MPCRAVFKAAKDCRSSCRHVPDPDHMLQEHMASNLTATPSRHDAADAVQRVCQIHMSNTFSCVARRDNTADEIADSDGTGRHKVCVWTGKAGTPLACYPVQL